MITKQGGRPTTATERMEAARAANKSTITRELCWAVIKAKDYTAWLGRPKVQNDEFPHVLVIESPVGPITYRIHVDELPLVAHLERRDVEVVPQSTATKEALLVIWATS